MINRSAIESVAMSVAVVKPYGLVVCLRTYWLDLYAANLRYKAGFWNVVEMITLHNVSKLQGKTTLFAGELRAPAATVCATRNLIDLIMHWRSYGRPSIFYQRGRSMKFVIKYRALLWYRAPTVGGRAIRDGTTVDYIWRFA